MLTSDQSFKKCVVVDGMQYVTEMQFELTIIPSSLLHVNSQSMSHFRGEKRGKFVF